MQLFEINMFSAEDWIANSFIKDNDGQVPN